MAKLETTGVKKQKAKKRKHVTTGTEDEVANKSVIVEANANENDDEPMQTNIESGQESKRKSKKRKNKEKGDIVEKRSKSLNVEEESVQDDHEGVDDLHEPTLEEIKESEKPENNLAIVTGRQKKKKKHQDLLEQQKGQSSEKDKQRNTNYLLNWKHERKSWKFEKRRQLSIQKTMLDSDILEPSVWPIALEYLAGTKGSAKATIVKFANDAIEEVDELSEKQETDAEKQTLLNSVKYQRARDLLQIFD